MAQHRVAAQTQQLCQPVVEQFGVDLVDVEFVREGTAWFLRLYIDKPGGVSLDDCTAVSQAVDPLIEAEVEIKPAYYLEVSSPGLDRPLKTQRDLLRHVGDLVEVKLYQPKQGQKQWTGRIMSCEAGVLTLMPEQGEEPMTFTEAERASVKQAIRFD